MSLLKKQLFLPSLLTWQCTPVQLCSKSFHPLVSAACIQWDRSKIFTLVLNYFKKQMLQLPLKAIARWTLNGGLFLLLLSVQGALLLLAINVRSSIAVDHFCFRLLCVHMSVPGECKEQTLLLDQQFLSCFLISHYPPLCAYYKMREQTIKP